MRHRKRKNLMDTRLGKLTVIGDAPNRGTRRFVTVKCDCGNVKEVDAASFSPNVKHPVKSCGCLKREMNKFITMFPEAERDTKRQSLLASSVQTYKHSAKLRGLNYSLTIEEAVKLILGDCYYCGRVGECKKELRNGIDRVDSSKGYESGNCVSCCIYCNQAKSDMTLTEFKTWLVKIYSHMMKENYANLQDS